MNSRYIIKAYTEYLQTLGFAPSTVYDFPRLAAHFLEYAKNKGVCQLSALSASCVRDYFTYMEQKKGERTKQAFSTAHLNRIFLATDKFLEFLHHTGVQNAPTPTRYTIEHHRQKPLQVLTRSEVQSLYNAASFTYTRMLFAEREPRQMLLKLVLDLCYGCGLRRSEALHLKITDVDFDKRIIQVRQGKNYKDRFVPMTGQVYKNIRTFIYEYRRHFAKRPGYLYPFCSLAMAKGLGMLLKCADNDSLKAKEPTLHTLRHSIATHLLQNGMDIEQIARFLGHSTLESTKLYTHIVNDYEDQQS